MSLKVELLRTSFTLVAERQPLLTKRFYEILFDRYPQLKSMFGRRSSEAQQEMLTQALIAVLDHLEDADWLTNTLASLGAKHVDYGVTAPMYDMVCECMLAAIAEAAGDAWSEDLAGAWSDALRAVSDLMLSGAERAMARAS